MCINFAGKWKNKFIIAEAALVTVDMHHFQDFSGGENTAYQSQLLH